MNGVLALLKPPAMTSQQAVSQVKRLLGASKAGHAGTLDPGAAGVLPICLGRATKLSDYLMGLPKTYIAELTVGCSTDTLDSCGVVTARNDVRVSSSSIEEALSRFTGDIVQLPPMYSALKVQGKPLYDYARSGREVERRPRSVHVEEFTMLEAGANRFLFRIVCSKGTYVRTLLHDLAASQGALGHTSFLLRSSSGGFTIDEAVTLAELEKAQALAGTAFRSPEQAVEHLPRIDLPGHLYPILNSGAPIDLRRVPLLKLHPNAPCTVFCRTEFFGVGVLEDNTLRLRTRIKI